MEQTLSLIVVFMIIGALFAIHARDMLSAVIAVGIVGYSLVICFLFLKAPDLAIVQIVVETITLIIMIAVILNSSRKELKEDLRLNSNGISYINLRYVVTILSVLILAVVMVSLFSEAVIYLEPLGEHSSRMSTAYMQSAAEQTGSANLVTGILFDFRGYDTLGEATVLFTAVIGVLTILRLKGRL
jgi:multisubunit Na+/H+ antiporter MnhB subunit